MTRFFEWWHSLSQTVRDGIIATILGGVALAVIGTIWKFSRKIALGTAKLAQRILNRALPPNESPEPNNSSAQPKEKGILDSLTQTPPKPETLSPGIASRSALIPKSPVVGFVVRRDTKGHDILEQLKKELAPGRNQLIALCGAGGLGKTTLAAEAARAVSESQCIVWTSADGRPEYSLSVMLDEIATQLGHADLRPLPLDQKDEQVRTVVVGSPSLIVLDNFETIVGEERTRCANWLARLPSCSAVITSRVEVPHAKPINIFAMSPTEAKKFVKLLIQEARNPHSFKGLNLDRIINTTDRNPLVMQWAMKQINRAQQPQTVLEQLAQGEGDAANRVFNRSFNLLSDDGRSALLAVSLFAPSASHQALAEVAGLEKDSERLNKAIGELADLWLIGTTEGNERLIVEGLTRELARAHLAKDARAADFRQRFVVHFQNYVRTHAKPTSEDFDALEAEKDNVLGAMDLAFEMEDWVSVKEMANVLAEPVDGMLRVRGYWDESIRRGEQAASAAEESGDEWGISQFTGNAATIRKDRGEYDEAKQAYERSLAAFRKLNSEENVAVFLHQLAIIAHDQGKLAEARRLYDESLEITRKLGDQRRIAYTLHQLAILAQHQGELAEARRLYDESLEVNKKLGDQGGIAMTLHQLAMLAQGQSDLPEARRLYDESLEIKTKLGDQSGIASTLHQLGRLAENEGDKSEAVRLFNESLIIFEKLGSPNAEIARRSLMRVQGESS